MERVYFAVCLGLGRLLRSAKYSKATIACEDGVRRIRKRRSFYAPLLVWLGVPLTRVLDTGVRVLAQRDWEARERHIYWRLHGTTILIEAGGVLVLPYLSGVTLATLLEDPALDDAARNKAIALAVAALARFHRLGFTHADAMAENVLVDLDDGVAHWFDFETVHDASRPVMWRRADDLRALLSTCVVRTPADKHLDVLQHMLDVYADEDVTPALAASFTSVFQRPLTFHLAQAGLPFDSFQEIARALRPRVR